MATYLVTGAAGFIGSHLVRRLLARGDRVRGLDNLSTGSLANLADLPDLDFVEGDVRDAACLRQVLAGVDYVLHHAAMVSVPQCLAEPEKSAAVNAGGTLGLLQAAQAAGGVRRFVLASSSAVYGDAHPPPVDESQRPEPLSAYAVHKLEAEGFVEAFGACHGIPGVRLRYFNVYGPRQSVDSGYAAVIPKFITRMLRALPPRVNGDGQQSRDFTFVDDIVEANLLACANPAAVGQVYNVACGEAISLLTLIDQLNAILGSALQPVFGAPLAGEVRFSMAETRAMREGLKLRSTERFADGLRATVDWYRKAAPGASEGVSAV
jgi:nucleoside-diphosphate-sugar epimerase